jgi:uncharacterized protein (TIGR03032 family)
MGAEIDLHVGAGFGRWLEGADATVVVSTYQAGKIVLFDHDGEKVDVLIRDLHAPMGLAADGARLAVALRESVVVFADAPDLAAVTYPTGDIRAHEIAFGSEGLWIVNTRFSCLCLASTERAFEPRWRPKFVSACVPEDRCHLSGLAMEGGAPVYVTAHAATDTRGGWRDRKIGGGVVVDVGSGEPVAGGFTMPHSPKIHDGALWLLDSGQGVVARVDRRSGARTAIASLPGFARGLAFHGEHALVGLSKIRESNVFGGMPVASRHRELYCGVAVVATSTGQVEGVVRFTSGCEEIFDVAILPGRHRVRLADPADAKASPPVAPSGPR